MKCPNCKQKTNSYTGKVINNQVLYSCVKCEVQSFTSNTTVTIHPEYTSFFTDRKTGNSYALDKKGRKHNVEDTPYANDNLGWKRSGKAPKRKKYFI